MQLFSNFFSSSNCGNSFDNKESMFSSPYLETILSSSKGSHTMNEESIFNDVIYPVEERKKKENIIEMTNIVNVSIFIPKHFGKVKMKFAGSTTIGKMLETLEKKFGKAECGNCDCYPSLDSQYAFYPNLTLDSIDSETENSEDDDFLHFYLKKKSFFFTKTQSK